MVSSKTSTSSPLSSCSSLYYVDSSSIIRSHSRLSLHSSITVQETPKLARKMNWDWLWPRHRQKTKL
ncbi:hypothetical protein OIU78_016612 [Salix suchowensis]|nr:hypothetical protein OIU78_016612 [Salix suchowensis]